MRQFIKKKIPSKVCPFVEFGINSFEAATVTSSSNAEVFVSLLLSSGPLALLGSCHRAWSLLCRHFVRQIWSRHLHHQ